MRVLLSALALSCSAAETDPALVARIEALEALVAKIPKPARGDPEPGERAFLPFRWPATSSPEEMALSQISELKSRMLRARIQPDFDEYAKILGDMNKSRRSETITEILQDIEMMNQSTTDYEWTGDADAFLHKWLRVINDERASQAATRSRGGLDGNADINQGYHLDDHGDGAYHLDDDHGD